MEEVIFNGPSGKLEGKYHHVDKKNAVALVLHPHPLHGGTMNNKVVYNTFHTFLNNDISVLRFNYRGVGRSEGKLFDGNEVMDAAAALDWLQEKNPDANVFWIAGFSYGAWIALQLLMRRPELTFFIAISPPAHSYDFGFLSPCPAPGLIIQGTSDTIVPEEAAYNLSEKLNKQRNSEVDYIPINNGDHFFTTTMPEFVQAIDHYIKSKSQIEVSVKKLRRDRRRRVIRD